MLHLITWYAMSLPFGYALVARYWPEERLPWGEFLVLALLVLLWPFTAVALLVARLGG